MQITLRPLRTEHAAPLYALTVDNRSHLRVWLPWVDHIHTLADTQAFVDDALRQTDGGTQLHFLIECDGRLVGTVGLIDIDAHQGTVGYWVDAATQGRGVMTAALNELKRIAFDLRGLTRLRLEYLEGNQASARVAEKCGFTLVEILPKQTRLHGRDVDRLCCVAHRQPL